MLQAVQLINATCLHRLTLDLVSTRVAHQLTDPVVSKATQLFTHYSAGKCLPVAPIVCNRCGRSRSSIRTLSAKQNDRAAKRA
jgi:hypothetical protein